MTWILDRETSASLASKVAVLAIQPQADVVALIESGETLSFESGEMLIRQGDVSDFALITVEGTVDVFVETRHGAVHLATLASPVLVGEIGIFTNVPRTASIRTTSDVRAVRLGAEALQRFARANPAFLSSMMLQLGRRLQTFNTAVGFFSHAFVALERDEFDLSLLDDLKNPLPELVDFSRSFHSLAKQITLRSAQRAEMANAKAIQEGMLPAREELAGCDGRVDVQAIMRPALDVGGDLYDFFFVDPDHLAVTVGDVCGKGIPAALFMAVTQMIMRYMLRREPDVGAAASAANSVLAASNPETMFTTMFSAVLDLRSGELTYCSCGHHSPLLMRAGGAVEKVPVVRNRPLGIDTRTEYVTKTTKLAPGDRLFLFTDGFVDAIDPQDERFGDPRLEQAVADLRDLPPQDFLDALVQVIHRFSGTAPQFDDITAVLVTAGEFRPA